MNRSPQRKRHNDAGSPAASCLPLPLLLAAIAAFSCFVADSQVRKSEGLLCASIASRASADISAGMEEIAGGVKYLHEGVLQYQPLDRGTALALAKSTFGVSEHIVEANVAPNAVVQYNFPEQGNGLLAGHDLLSNPERRDALLLAATEKKPVFAGPFESVDGRRMLFLRDPVFMGDRLWGYVSLGVDFDGLMESIAPGKLFPGMRFAISGADGRLVWGYEPALRGAASFAALKLPGLDWNLHVLPQAGLAGRSPFMIILLVSAMLGPMFLFLALLWRTRARERAARESGMIRQDRDEAPKGAVGDHGDAEAARPASERPASAWPESAGSGYGLSADARDLDAGRQPGPHGQDPISAGQNGAGAPGSIPDAMAVEGAAKPEDPRGAPPAGQQDGTDAAQKSAGRTLRFKGSDVPGEIFMPDKLRTVLFDASGECAGADAGLVDAREAAPGTLPDPPPAAPELIADTFDPVPAAPMVEAAGSEEERKDARAKQKGRREPAWQEMLFRFDDDCGEGQEESAVNPSSPGMDMAAGAPEDAGAPGAVEEPGAAKDAGGPGAANPDEPPATAALLVVDDSEVNRDLMGRMLGLRGLEADFASSGEQALELCASRRYDIIFLDCFMPEMDGYRAAGAIRAGGGEGGSPVIIGMSARIGQNELERCRSAGMDDLLAKPFTQKELVEFLRKYGAMA